MTDPRCPIPSRATLPRGVLVLVVLLLALAGCGGTAAPQAAGVNPGAGVPEIPEIPQVPGVPAEPPIDVCRLLTSEEVTAVIGAHNGGRLDPGIGAGSCYWRNDETYSSITVRIGRAGTAPGDRLPEPGDYGPTEPGPAGIRFAPNNVAEFAVDGRACDLQVVTDVMTDADRPTAARMIGLVRDRL
ncbi:hypothetical protein [Pseudonocardia acidicola]|uniref:DUF3558 domain-containing protein n=1 Tax=Pseudonocardia acidicola TaxID=2724939 RepID=A0ABX1S2C6_9PSEU|nr:hypothetical protein [Pseudonocardia acidicola]NMH95724.1 hypothetical protein [Pseudonocardia acidicola]